MRTALHDELLDIMSKHPADYAPWGAVERWADNKRHDWYVPRTNLGAF